MTVAVLVPFTSDEPWRVRARDHTVGWYRALGYDVVEGACDAPWRKAVAVADAARRTVADVLVVADADCLCAGIAEAHAAVDAAGGWAIPHLMVHRLDEAATEAVYAGGDPASTTSRTQRAYKGCAGGGIVVLSRAVYDQVPLDPRFAGWGQEDEAWAMALATLAGPPARFDHDLFHLFHPPPRRFNRRWGAKPSRLLHGRYRAADGQPETMRALLDETATCSAKGTI